MLREEHWQARTRAEPANASKKNAEWLNEMFDQVQCLAYTVIKVLLHLFAIWTLHKVGSRAFVCAAAHRTSHGALYHLLQLSSPSPGLYVCFYTIEAAAISLKVLFHLGS
jgi:hypothetical protein